MAEPIKTPTSEVYAKEAKYMESQLRHSADFNRLIEFVPEAKDDVRTAMISCYHVEPDRLLDSEKLQKLKDENKSLWEAVVGFYRGFLDNELGFN